MTRTHCLYYLVINRMRRKPANTMKKIIPFLSLLMFAKVENLVAGTVVDCATELDFFVGLPRHGVVVVTHSLSLPSPLQDF